MELGFTKGELLQGAPIENGWYKCEILKETLATVEGKLNYTIIFGKFENPALKADERFVEHVFRNILDQKQKGFLTPLIAAVQQKNVKEIVDAMEAGTPLNFQFGEGQLVGTKMQILIFMDQYQGRPQIRVQNFLPYAAEPLPL